MGEKNLFLNHQRFRSQVRYEIPLMEQPLKKPNVWEVLPLERVSFLIKSFWDSFPLFIHLSRKYISRTCWASVRAGYPRRWWTKSDLHARRTTTPRPLRTSPGVFSSPQGRTRVAVVTFQSIFVRLFFAWTISWDEAQTAKRFEIITLLFPSAGRAGTSFTSCFRPFDFLLTYANLNLKKKQVKLRLTMTSCRKTVLSKTVLPDFKKLLGLKCEVWVVFRKETNCLKKIKMTLQEDWMALHVPLQ